MEEMSSMERVTAVLNHKIPDRVPVIFWALTIGAREAGIKMFEYSTDGKKMAEGQLNYLKRYGVDAVIPGSGIAEVAEMFGTKTKYYDTMYDTPAIGETVVKKPDDWEKLELSITPGISASLEATLIIREETNNEVPVMGTVVSPLTLATWIRGMAETIRDTRKNPDELHKGLNIITDIERDMVDAQISLGTEIFFMPITRASRDLFTDKQYKEFGIPYDLKVLESLKSNYVIGHVCGNYPMLDTIIERYPLSAVNWWDRGTKYSLKDGRDMKERYNSKVVLVGGLDQNKTLIMGTPKDVENEARDAIEQVAIDGEFILSGGCELSAITPPENILAAVETAKRYGKYPIGWIV